MRRALALTAVALTAACTVLTGADELEVGGDDPSSLPGRADASADGSGTVSSSGGSSSGNPPPTPTPPPPPTDAGGDAADGSCVVAYGPKYATLAGGTGWTTPDNGRVLDGATAKSAGSHSGLILTGFGFAIPANATIVGVAIDVSRAAVGTVDDVTVTMGPYPTVYSKTSKTPWPAETFNATYPVERFGGPTDLWGAQLTPASFNASAFGLGLAIGNTSTGDGHVDAIGVTVYACP